MKLITTLFLLAFTSYCTAQISIARDTTIDGRMALILTNDSVVKQGTLLKTGRGTLPNGDFKYISTSSSSAIAIFSQKTDGTNDAIMPLGRRFSGLNLEVKSIKKYGNKKRGFKYQVKVGGGNIVNYELDLDDALYANEIIFKPTYAPPQADSTKTN